VLPQSFYFHAVLDLDSQNQMSETEKIRVIILNAVHLMLQRGIKNTFLQVPGSGPGTAWIRIDFALKIWIRIEVKKRRGSALKPTRIRYTGI
jgi:hypothetical protein